MVSLSTTFAFLGGFILFSSVVAQIDWCQVKSDYCWGEHIACEPNSFPTESTCMNVVVVPMTSTLKNFILDRHNEYRQVIASGGNSKFPAAEQMTVMQWDDDIAFLAEKHVAHCSFQHDECRATPNYPYSGQNLYYESTWGSIPNATEAVENGMQSWFDEWEIADPNIVHGLDWNMWQAFHFSVMLNDQNDRVGCALINYEYMMGTWIMDAFMLTCNYGYTNFIDEPMYATGTPCSQCTCSTTYPALCN